MLKKKVKFDHDEKSVFKACGVDKNKISEIIGKKVLEKAFTGSISSSIVIELIYNLKEFNEIEKIVAAYQVDTYINALNKVFGNNDEEDDEEE